jgi:hypothetical protein
VLSSGKDWYLHVRVVDGAGNWASDSYTVGPFLVSQNAVAQGDPLQIPGWLPLLIVLAVICVIVLALFMAAENGRRQRERRAAQMQMQQAQYHYQYQGVYPPPQQPGNVHVTTYHAPICPRCGRVDMGSTYCPYCGWRMR